VVLLINYIEKQSPKIILIKLHNCIVISWHSHYRGDFSDSKFLNEKLLRRGEEVWKD